MKKTGLNQGWKVIGANPQSCSLERVVKPDLLQNWMNINVPGDVNHALQLKGLIPDPHYDTQASECYWITSKEWWYLLEFDADECFDMNTDLCLTNVDGHTDIWLNDTYISGTKNAFRMFRFPITSYLKEKNNLLYIRFKSIDQLLDGPRLDPLEGWRNKRAFLRKPQFSFGWDWALPLPSIGLSGDVWLEYDHEYRFVDFSVQPFISGRVDFAFEVTEEAKNIGYEIECKLWGHGCELETTVSRNAYKTYTSFEIPDPKLWYPNGFGEQPLYQYQVNLVIKGQVKDTRTGRIGLRESNIVEKPFTPDAGPGISFGIEINGEQIFCKGGNWIPMEIWPGTVKVDEYRTYLTMAKDANFNMLRVWGGGIYEHEYFYDLCDELGIMVWQDFMFASTGYPVKLLQDEIIAEANYQIRRLRNHSSIVLWCGCNEDVYSWSYKGDKSTSVQNDIEETVRVENKWQVDRVYGDPILYTMILRGLTSKFGLGVPYIESSPQSRDDYGNMPNSGNCHISSWKYSLFECEGQYRNWRNHFNQV
ncbi:MAG TPA: hypothetical protein DDZ89_12380, partial [Clostridiales bacterium]|nr:hypothetical protein [Clostridiales bacterium]